MRWMWVLLCALLLAGPAAAVQGPGPDGGSPDLDAAASEAGLGTCAPPCGYINPLIDLVFEDKPPCGGGVAVRTTERPTDCIPLPEEGETYAIDGILRWYWKVSEDGTYPDDPQNDIEISFSGTASNPSFLSAEVEPSGFTITTADLFDPANFRTEETENGAELWFWFERPINVTFTREGDPQGDEAERLEDRAHIQNYFLKAKSTSSGERYKEAFGVEEFRFDALAEAEADSTKGAPGLGPLLVLPALVALAALRRR